MGIDAAQGALLAIAVVAANYPFFNGRFLAFYKPKQKGMGWEFLEWLAMFALVGVLAYFTEARTSEPHDQKLSFWVIVVCLFALFAFPGFVYRHLWKKPQT